jgi:hypothetical protein
VSELIPSLEYGPLSYRWIGADEPIRFIQKIPYEFLGGSSRRSSLIRGDRLVAIRERVWPDTSVISCVGFVQLSIRRQTRKWISGSCATFQYSQVIRC